MRRLHPECPNSDSSERSLLADIFFRQDPDGEDDEEEDGKIGEDDDEEDDGETDDGYSE